ncbi:hypothetical protein [Streptomyces toxytricini]|uniref:hypothetical protein n=1 Tax=Streptomyces toxytricini TaxID=67369 RepID=UPI00343600DA
MLPGLQLLPLDVGVLVRHTVLVGRVLRLPFSVAHVPGVVRRVLLVGAIPLLLSLLLGRPVVGVEEAVQPLAETVVHEERMLTHGFRLYRDSERVRTHWKPADPRIENVMRHCRVERFAGFGEPDPEVAAAVFSALGGGPSEITFNPRIAGFVRFG